MAQSSIAIKRKQEFSDEESTEKYQRVEPLRHCTVDYNLVNRFNSENIYELFSTIRLIGYDEPKANVRGHFHVVGFPKLTKRNVRDISKASLEAMGIHNPQVKLAFLKMHFNQIKYETHFNNIINYIKRKSIVFENPDISWKPENRQSIISKIKELKNRPKHSQAEMAEFRQEYPQYNSWKADCIKLRLNIKSSSSIFRRSKDEGR